MTRFRFVLLAAVAVVVPLVAQGQDSTLADDDGPAWLYADSLFVQEPSWISGATVATDILVLSFRDGTSPARKSAIIQQVHGTIVWHDRVHRDSAYYVRVATHPDACGVKQALDVLDPIPEVEFAVPHEIMTWIEDSGASKKGHVIDGGIRNAPATHKGSKRPCPSGSQLLR